MTNEDREKLQTIIDDFKIIEDKTFSDMDFLRNHGFEFEHFAVKLRYDAYHEIRIQLEMFRDKIL